MSLKHNIFISYARENEDIVREIYSKLINLEYSIWIDFINVQIGDNLWTKIEDGLNNSKVILCFISKAYCESDSCEKELSRAVRLKRIIVPVILENDQKGGVAALIANKAQLNAYKELEQFRKGSGDLYTQLIKGNN